jgi:phosphohistidine phosphatase
MIYLVHHADAVAPEIDAQRPLSERGRAMAAQVAQDAAAKGVKPVAIWHSGKLRARQTAEFFLKACNPLAELSAIRGLQPDDPPAWIRDAIADEPRDLMFVGHMPHLPRLYAVLVTGSEQTRPEFPMHGLVALEKLGDAWVERWRLLPRS